MPRRCRAHRFGCPGHQHTIGGAAGVHVDAFTLTLRLGVDTADDRAVFSAAVQNDRRLQGAGQSAEHAVARRLETPQLDVGRRDWSEELLKASGMRRDQMPRLVEGSEVSGQIRAELAERFGMPAGVVVAGGGVGAGWG